MTDVRSSSPPIPTIANKQTSQGKNRKLGLVLLCWLPLHSNSCMTLTLLVSIKGVRHEDFASLGQFCAKIIT